MLDNGFSQEEIDLLLANIDQLDEAELAELEGIVSDLAERQRLQILRDDLIAFCCHMQSDYKVGGHHKRLASLLEDIEARRKDRICVSVPPRHGKSQLVSIYYAAWYMGRNPTHKVMLVSHTTDLAVDFGRKIRNLIASAAYREVFPDVSLASDSKSAGRWSTNQGGEFFAAGVGSALAGRGAHLLLVDDPHSEQDILNGNYNVFDKAYEWFTFGARTRLMPGGAVAIVHCMTGDTAVLMADGGEKALRDVRPGDMLASYERGQMVHKKVLNWTNQGPDNVYTLLMDDGNLIRANARHPFLAVRDGVETWVKLRDLIPGDNLVSLRGVTAAQGRGAQRGGAKYAKTASSATGKPKGLLLRAQNLRRALRMVVKTLHARAQRRESARHVSRATHTIGKTQLPNIAAPAIGGSIGVKPVKMLAAMSPFLPKICAPNTTTATTTRVEKPQGYPTTRKSVEVSISAPDMVSNLNNIPLCVSSRGTDAGYVGCTPARSQNQQRGGMTTRLQSTIATIQGVFARFYATPATLSCTTDRASKSSNGQFNTSKIISITPDGVEDVFDIQVEDTENFIANGVVSHNTRWAPQDLIGRVVGDMTKNEGSDQYEVFEFPAILDITDPVTGEPSQRALWPEFFDIPALLRTKASMPTYQWNAQYQQQPTSEEAAVVKREWWQQWERDQPPPCDYIIMSLDAAAETNNRADYTSLTVWGVFLNEDTDCHNLILLHAIKDRFEFPELKRMALEQYARWEPDGFIVEKKSAGVALYQELRRTGLPVQEYTPHRGSGDKMARLNSVADIIASGIVWVPDRRWAEEVVEEIAAFPFGPNDDHVDSTVMALLRFRQGGFIALPTDEIDEPEYSLPHREGYY